MSSPGARLAGGASLVGSFLGLEALIVGFCGATPANWTGVLLGAFLGLVSLAIEIGMLERSARTFHAQGVQTTFLSFMMRLAVVAPLMLLFSKAELGIGSQAFALSYLSTFFLYMCWLTWETYHAPVQYRPKVAKQPIVVRDRREPAAPRATGAEASPFSSPWTVRP